MTKNRKNIGGGLRKIKYSTLHKTAKGGDV